MRVNPAENYRNTVIFLELCGQSTHLLILDGLNMEADEVGLQFDDPLQDQILLVQQPGQPGNGQIILVVKQGLVVNQMDFMAMGFQYGGQRLQRNVFPPHGNQNASHLSLLLRCICLKNESISRNVETIMEGRAQVDLP